MMNNSIDNHITSRVNEPTLACEKCRALKVKCVRVKQGQPCIKCSRTNSECVVRARKRPTRPTQRTKPRLVDIESKLGDLLDILSRSNAPPNPGNAALRTSRVSAMADDFGQDHEEVQRIEESVEHEDPIGFSTSDILTLNDNLNASQQSLESESEISTSTHNAWITDLGLMPTVLQHLLENFRRMDKYFPFVLLSGDLTPTSMAEERPVLLLAAAASASSQYPHLQKVLIEKFKQTLSHRVIEEGEKDLDLLQGLLVHLAWFHFHLVPRTQQTYRYLQIAISMVIDLGLEQDCHGLSQGDFYSREACRAYLGCYFISSTIAVASAKPNNLPFSECMLQYATVLREEQEFDTDQLIYPLIKLQHFSEEVYEVYHLDAFKIRHPWLCSHAERLIARVEEWWSVLAADLQGSVLLMSGYHSMKIRIHEMGLVYQYGQKRPRRPEPSEDQPVLSTPPMVIANLIQCTKFTKEYLDGFLVIPTKEYGILPLSIWYQLILALFVLYRLSVGLPEVPEWNAEVAQQIADLEGYLGLLVRQLYSTRTESDGQFPNRSLFAMFSEIIESVKTSYEMARNHPQPGDDIHAHETFQGTKSRQFSSIRSNKKHRCPGFQNLSRDTTHTPATPNSTEHCPLLPTLIAEEIGRIEDERFWGDLLTANALADMSNT